MIITLLLSARSIVQSIKASDIGLLRILLRLSSNTIAMALVLSNQAISILRAFRLKGALQRAF